MTSDSPGRRAVTHSVVRWMFLRLLGLTALIATLSLTVQAEGLFGTDGILPADVQLGEVERFGESEGWSLWDRFRRVPTIGWFVPGGSAVDAAIALSLLGSLMLLFNAVPLLGALLAFFGYLSLQTMGGVFTGYQWDILLIEVQFCSFFLTPGGVRPGFAWDRRVSPAGLLVHRALLFKVMFLSVPARYLYHTNTRHNYA